VIRVDGEVPDSILEKINGNIYYIIELFIEVYEGLGDVSFLGTIFPMHLVRKNKDRCMEVIEELTDYTQDSYLHTLTPIQQHALFFLLEWCIDVETYDFDQVVGEEEIKTDEDRIIAEHINDIDFYLGLLFNDWDFLEDNLSKTLQYYKIYGPAYEQFQDINIEEYIELLPDDKKEEYYKTKGRFTIKKGEEKKGSEFEGLIVRQIYQAIKLREMDPVRLKATSETELSNDIRDIIKEKLHENGINISREMPSGFSKTGIGECDFYLDTYVDGIYKTLAIGENKEWGKFESQLKQLIGYMTKDVQFGFTIVFNKRVKINTVLTKRIEILKNFYVEKDGIKHFQVVDGVYEHIEMRDLLMTTHENPERKGSYFRLHHFVINANSAERQESANQARR
jgi:hypothetical protein